MNTSIKRLSLGLICLLVFACTQGDKNEQDSQITNEQTKENSTVQHSIAATYPTETPTGRLPNSIRPLNYTLDLTIDPDKANFSGTTTIEIKSDVETSHLFLHGRDLVVEKVVLKNSVGESVSGNYAQVDETGVAKIEFDSPLTSGLSELVISYSAPFNQALEGLYKVNDDGLNYAFTQFEATSARLSFPGFDEPAFKVPFTTSLTIKNEHKGFSNTPQIASVDLGNGMKRLDFATSKPLPTYLIAYAVGDLDVVEWEPLPANSVRENQVPLQGLATKGKGGKLTYALEHTYEIVKSLEDYFGIPYPYEKLDIVAVPDFAFGAMENAGLIVYREQLLLFDDTISLNQKRRYANVHAHELAHQWFGNLVTPEWWDDIWLNEAFATWVAHITNDNIYPEQKFRQTLMQRSLGAMANDSLISARQIRQPIASNHDIQSAFDGITYSKGGGVLRMFESFIGPEQFQAGITHYMNKYAFANATSTDFITAIGEKSDKASIDIIRSAFNSFLEQPGIPYLNVNTSCETDNAVITLSQSRYLPIGSAGETKQKWQVPVCLNYQIDENNHKQCQLITKQTESIQLEEKGCPSFIVPNTNGSGYYRFALKSEEWQSIFSNQDKLTTEEMMAIIDSFNASINAGQLTFTDLVEVAPKIISSDSSRIASSPTALLSFAYERIADTPAERSALATLNTRLYQDRLNSLGLKTNTSDTVDTIQLRNTLLGFMAEEGESVEVREYLSNMAIAYTGYKTDKILHPELADSNTIGIGLTVATEDLGEPFVRHLISLFQKETDGTIRSRLLSGISSVKNEAMASELRGWILSDQVRDNEIYSLIYGQMSNEKLRPAMWEWFKLNIEGVKARISSFSQNRIPYVGTLFCSSKDRVDVDSFFKPIIDDISGGPRALAQTLESIDLCIARVKYHSEAVNNYTGNL